MNYYINMFFICSFFGYVMETILKTFFFKGMNNGILFGPLIPVYGLGAVLIIFIMRFVFNRLNISRWIKVILLFVCSMIILTVLELVGGMLIEEFTGKIFWDYSFLKFNIGHYIALEISLVWGVFSLVFVYILKPLVDKIIKKIPRWVTILVLVLFFVDVIISCLSIFHILHLKI